jgi:chromosomal replication initiation ATPase DnaA
MDRGLTVADEVILYALPRMERSFAAARRLVADLDAAALGRRRKITVSLLREILETSGGAA